MSNYDLIPDEVSTGGTSNRKQRLLGEAYGLRAFYYFQLFTMWGGVPIVDKPIDLGETTGTTLTRASASEIVDFILQDLERLLVCYRRIMMKANWDVLLKR